MHTASRAIVWSKNVPLHVDKIVLGSHMKISTLHHICLPSSVLDYGSKKQSQQSAEESFY